MEQKNALLFRFLASMLVKMHSPTMLKIEKNDIIFYFPQNKKKTH